MANILGLMSTQQFSSHFSETARRQVFYEYPNGAAPLTGILSLLDSEETDKPKFGWWEDRYKELTLTLDSSESPNTGPFATAAGGDPGDFAPDDSTQYRCYVTDGEIESRGVRPGDVLWFKDITLSDASTGNRYARVDAVDATNDYLTIKFQTDYSNDTAIEQSAATNDNLEFYILGSSIEEGARSGTGSWTEPIEIQGLTQIHRTAFAFTRNALKAGVRWDSTGVYRDRAKKEAMRHMVQIENQTLFGSKVETTVTDDDGVSVPLRSSPGILWYLRQWEEANGGSDSLINGGNGYTPGATAATANTDDRKRIININGTVSKQTFENYLERGFRYTNDTNFEKLMLCGSGFISVFNQMVARHSLATRRLNTKDAYGMNIVEWETPHGIVYLKSHPLMSRITEFRNSCFMLDVGNLNWRPFQDSDTELLTNRQNNDEDRRKDEWITEGGLELHFPESHMFFDNVTEIT